MSVDTAAGVPTGHRRAACSLTHVAAAAASFNASQSRVHFTLEPPEHMHMHCHLFYLFIYLLLKSYSKYKIDRDRNITHGTDINIRKKFNKKTFKKHANQCTCNTVFMRHIY